MCIKFNKLTEEINKKRKVLTFNFKTNKITYGDISCLGSCIVRNELNGKRKLHVSTEVVYPIVNGMYYDKPYMPREFPKGKWKITGIEWTNDPEFAPVKIKTDATQLVHLWTTDKSGGYDTQTSEVVRDSGYYFHHSTFNTTLGCIKILNEDDAINIATEIETALAAGEYVAVEVI